MWSSHLVMSQPLLLLLPEFEKEGVGYKSYSLQPVVDTTPLLHTSFLYHLSMQGTRKQGTTEEVSGILAKYI